MRHLTRERMLKAIPFFEYGWYTCIDEFVMSQPTDTIVENIVAKLVAITQTGTGTAVTEGGSADTYKVVLTADSQGHFQSLGSINGQTVNFMVDTGATWVILGQAEAQRIGLKAQQGSRVRVNTANGTVDGHEHRLDKVRLGDAEVRDVKAVVLPQPMPFVLLGNSFLTRFQMVRVNDQMTLERKP